MRKKMASWATRRREPEYGAKVFCIGYNKTGTSSVGRSFELMGLRNTSFNLSVWKDWYLEGEVERVLDYMARFDSADDLPWLLEDMIPILDNRFPKSRFVYLTRDEESWRESYYRWRIKTFSQVPDMDQMWKKYKAHERFVSDYFSDCEDGRYIALDVRDKSGFATLANFLDRPATQQAFPWLNKT